MAISIPRALTPDELAERDSQPRHKCALSFCNSPAKRYQRKRKNGVFYEDARFCQRHDWELYNGGIFVDVDDDWEY